MDISNSDSLQVIDQPGLFQGILLALPCSNLQYWKFIDLTQRDKPGALHMTLQQKHHMEKDDDTSKSKREHQIESLKHQNYRWKTQRVKIN